MGYTFTDNDVIRISEVLGKDADINGANITWRLNNPEIKQSLVISLYNEIMLGKSVKGSMISVQTLHGYFELHDCLGFVIFEPDEIIFVEASKYNVSCLIIGKQCTCSMYSNIRREILHADFNTVDPAVLLSAMQLSLTESILPE